MNPLALQVLIATSGVAEGWMAPSLDGRPAPAPEVPPLPPRKEITSPSRRQ
jgi:hypothetical protein